MFLVHNNININFFPAPLNRKSALRAALLNHEACAVTVVEEE